MISKAQKHILYLSRWYPSDADPMLGLFVRNHARAAVQAGYQVTVAYITASKEKEKNLLRVSTDIDDNLTEVIVYYKSSGVFNPLLQLLAWIRAVRVALETNGKPDAIHANILTRSAFIAMILSMWYKVPYMITEHWSRYYDENPDYKGFVRKIFTQMVIKKASAVTVVSKRLYKAMRRNGLNFNQEILPNVVDTDVFRINENRNKTFRFISISCFEEKSKNLKMIIDAAVRLEDTDSDFQIVFVGNGTDRKLIEQYAGDKAVAAVFTGTLSPEGAASVLGQSHCLVLSSNYETFGIVAYEALLSGIPVIATDVADLSEVIDSKNGMVIPVGDTAALVAAMLEVKQNYQKYDPLLLRESVVGICSNASVSGRLNQLYQQITG